MFSLYASTQRKHPCKKEAFSLVEVMVTILVLSLIMVAMTPVITKKRPEAAQTGGVIFTYGTSNSTEDDRDVCFATTTNNYNNGTNVQYQPSTRCSEYTFTVPDGVTRINLTLVGGGGGGGGASGARAQSTTINAYDFPAKVENVDFDKLSSVVINYLSAQGTAAFELDDGCAESGEGDEIKLCGTKGGKSSAAISNFKIENIHNIGSGVNAPLEKNAAGTTKSIVLSKDLTGAMYVELSDAIRYFVNPPDIDNPAEIPIGCVVAGNTYLYLQTGFADFCSVPDESILAEVEGEYGAYVKPSENTTNDTILTGGKGGSTNSTYSSYGSGANGRNVRTSCNNGQYTCSAEFASANYNDAAITSNPGSSIASVTYTTETPGAIGSGGSGGSVFRVTGFPVTAGDTYTIRVGAGGEGGGAGIDAVGVDNPTDGENGGGGTSTAIYDSNGRIVFMVAGGLGGEGGSAPGAGADLPDRPRGLGYQSAVFSSDADNFSRGSVDTNVINMTENTPASTPNTGSRVQGRRIEYPFMDTPPRNALNYPNNNYNASNPTQKNTNLSPFMAFNTDRTNYDRAENLDINNVYDGLYFRSVIGNYPAYTGGPGGLSGLGTKAGCGGLFMGNNGEHTAQDGDDEDRTETLNRIIIDEISYNITDFYDNCSLSTPDGQSANFVLPTVNGPTFGSAGAGGGGGAWSPTLGAGKGGRGQDGYLMIEWRR